MPSIQILASLLLSILFSYLTAGTSQLLIAGKFQTLWSLRTKILIACSSLTYFLAFQTILPTYPIYFLFITALWISIHTDLNHQLISRFASLYIAPIALLACYLNMLPISWIESLITSILCAGLFYSVNKIFYCFKGHDGLGQGDVELFGCIGAWIGAVGAWFVLLASSTLGTLVGCLCMFYTGKRIQLLPFGPFLAISALLYIFFNQNIFDWMSQSFFINN